MHMEDHHINTWRMMHKHSTHVGHSINMHQCDAYLEVIEGTVCTEQPGAAL